MAELEKKWYVIRVAGGKEKKAKEYIESEIKALGLDNYVAQILIPTEKIYQVRNGKKVSKESIFFPGYVLIETSSLSRMRKISLPSLSERLSRLPTDRSTVLTVPSRRLSRIRRSSRSWSRYSDARLFWN